MTRNELPVELDLSNDERLIGGLQFNSLTSTEFEDFCFDLVTTMGFDNVDWRKGTPRSTSPGDHGRDIEASRTCTDLDGHSYQEHWFIECKHYERGVPPSALQGVLTWAQSERPSAVLIIASGHLSNGTKDWLKSYERENRPAFRIRTWEMPQLRSFVARHPDVAFRHDVPMNSFRRVSDIFDAEAALSDQLWYGRRKPDEGRPPANTKGKPDPMDRIEAQYGKAILDRNVESDFAWGYLSGRVSAIRWVLGYDWHMLDS